MSTPMPFFGMFPFMSGTPKPEKGNRRGTVLSVCAQKGGVGKTTTAVHVAAGLADGENVKVLLIDADPQGHAGACVPFEEGQQSQPELDALILERQAELLTGVRATQIPGLDVVPAGSGLGESEQVLSGRIGKEGVLRSALEVTRTHYDYVVIDCPPSMSTLAVAALTACNGVIVPCELSPLTIRGLEELVRSLAEVHQRLNPHLNILGMVVNRVDYRNKRLNADTLEDLSALAGNLLFDTFIRTSTALARAQHVGKPVFMYDDRSPAADDYRSLVAEVRQRASML